MLSAFACTPSVLANDVPVVTLQAKNIQVHADWQVVGDDADHFSVEGGILRLRPVTWDGYPESSNTITAIVEVRDKFSTLNPSYEDLTVRVTITAVIMGCYAHWTRNFAKSRAREDSDPSNQILVRSGEIDVGDVIVRRGDNHIYLYTVSATFGYGLGGTYITTDPTSLYDNLKWSFGGTQNEQGNTSLRVNESEDCFAEEIEAFQEQQEQQQILQEKTDYLNVHAPLISGFYAGLGRAVTVGTAFVLDGKQHFYLNLTLANILNELYTPKVIIDDGKVFRIDNKYPSDNRYEYVSNLTAGSDSVHGDKYNQPHEVIVVNNCPPVLDVLAWREGSEMRISASDIGKVRKYMVIRGITYDNASATYFGVSVFKGVESYKLQASGFEATSIGPGDYPIKFADHFLCGTE